MPTHHGIGFVLLHVLYHGCTMTQLAGINMALRARSKLLRLQEIGSNPGIWHGVPACFHSC